MVGSVHDAVPMRMVVPRGVTSGSLAARSTATARSPATSDPGSWGLRGLPSPSGSGGMVSGCTIWDRGARSRRLRAMAGAAQLGDVGPWPSPQGGRGPTMTLATAGYLHD